MNTRWSAEPTESAPTKEPVRPPLSGRRRWLFRLIAAGIPSVLGMALLLLTMVRLEYVIFDPETGWPQFQSPPVYVQEPGQELTGHRYLYDPQLGWRNISNWRATTMGKPLHINSKGLRDTERDYAKPAGVRRILVLGDSFAWGYGVANDETFARQLENRLDHWEVVNTGVSGWGTDQQLLFFEQEGIQYSPDIVVLAFFLFNDPKNNVRSIQYGLSKPVFLDLNLQPANIPVPKPGKPKVDLKSEAEPIELTAAIIGRLADVCQRQQCRLVVMKFGSFLGLEIEKMAKWNRQLAAAVAQMDDVGYLDLDAEFATREILKPQLVEGNNDGHWNAFGHRLTAEILANYLATQGYFASEATVTGEAVD